MPFARSVKLIKGGFLLYQPPSLIVVQVMRELKAI